MCYKIVENEQFEIAFTATPSYIHTSSQPEMWANAQHDGRPAEPVQRRKVWLTLTTLLLCSNAACQDAKAVEI